MKHNMIKNGNCSVTVTAGAIFACLLAIVAIAAPERRSLTRTEDFLVMTGSDFDALIGAEISDLRLYSCEGRACFPIPVQIDKVDMLGRYVFPQDINLDRDGSKLDENDEVSFMVSDAGDRMPSGWRPDGANGGVEITIIDPLDNGVAWAYLFDQPGAPVPSLADYVEYRLEGEYIFMDSPQYLLGHKEKDLGWTIMKMRTAAGDLGQDILDRQRVGVETELAGDVKVPLNIPESIIRTEDSGVIDGPIRIIVDQVLYFHVGELSYEYSSENFNKYYRCGQNNSVYFSFPLGINELFKSVLFYYSLDFTPDMLGSYYVDQNQPSTMKIKDETRKQVPNDSDHFWWGLYGRQGALLQALDLDDYMLPYFTCEGRWRQNPNPVVKKGDAPGRLEIGFNCHELGSLPERKDYHWFNYILFPQEPSKQGLDNLRKIFEDPLEVETYALP